MRAPTTLVSLALICLMLAGCAAVTSAPAGTLKVGKASVTLSREWSNVSAIAPALADSVAAMDYQRVEILRPRPGKFKDRSAVRFDLTAQTSDGLEISGTALVAEQAGRIHIILYLAPAEHYFGASLADVESVIASVG
ncbi:MAG: hypothetical protein B7Z12_19810 [Caulobacter vibrioides]|uniref:Lipoprotein n=1 Tax=Caulobacter vibrioides TaxID=155892 RepID=A0A258CSL7_CAUVI|nr:MAG: hypothetical protein B7Z12_19810 [Caulobacter vibrioides]